MENYLAYLEKLQSKMDFSKNVDDKKVALYFDMKNVNQRLSTLFILVLVSLELLLYIIGMTADAAYRNIIMWVMVVILLFFGFTVLMYGGNAVYYKNLACYERDKIYFANYDIVKNEILNDGVEHMQQLVTWWRMCELSSEDKEKYAELLRIVHDVCREYALILR